MGKIINVQIYNKNGTALLVSFTEGRMDQGGTITVNKQNASGGSIKKLKDRNSYKIKFTSAGKEYTVSGQLEEEYGKDTLSFLMAHQSSAASEATAFAAPSTGSCYSRSDCQGNVLGNNVTKDDCFNYLGGKSWKKSGTTRCEEN